MQEAQDFAAIAHAATLASRVPFLHFFDGFRTSHEVAKIESLPDEVLRGLIDPEGIALHRGRALTPDRPVLRGTAQNPDTFFQAREASNRFTLACPDVVEATMRRFAEATGRAYRLFDYAGHPEAERVLVLMGSGAETAHETVDWLVARGEKVGVLKVRLYRPFDAARFAAALPISARVLAVLDRTKEPGAVGEPLYQDVVAALVETREDGARPRVVGGRYGLSSKEFTPAMVAGIFEELDRPAPRNHFTVGIVDDVTHTSLPWDEELDIEPDEVRRAVFFGLGSDGTVGANRNSVKILGEETEGFAQAYFVYDSKKSGAVTVSHLRVSPRPIRSSYLDPPRRLRRLPPVRAAPAPRRARPRARGRHAPPERARRARGGLGPAPPRGPGGGDREEAPDLRGRRLPDRARERPQGPDQHDHADLLLRAVRRRCRARPRSRRSRRRSRTTYAKKGPEVLKRNFAAVDRALDGLSEIAVPAAATADARPPARGARGGARSSSSA